MRAANTNDPRGKLYLIHSRPRETSGEPLTGTTRNGRIQTRSNRLQSGYQNHPLIRLSGRWLEKAGFPQGQAFRVEVEKGRLVLRTV